MPKRDRERHHGTIIKVPMDGWSERESWVWTQILKYNSNVCVTYDTRYLCAEYKCGTK